MSTAVISSLCQNYILNLKLPRNTKYFLSFRPLSYVILSASRCNTSYQKNDILKIKNNFNDCHTKNTPLLPYTMSYSTTINKSAPDKVNLEQQVKQMAFLKRQKQFWLCKIKSIFQGNHRVECWRSLHDPRWQNTGQVDGSGSNCI